MKDKFIEKLEGTVNRVFENDKNKERRTDMNRWLKEYTGKWWNEDELKKYDSHIFCNYIFSTIQTTAPLLTDNRPTWNVRAREPYFQNYANVYAKALDYLWDKLDLDNKTYLVVKDCLLWPVGLLKVRFDPKAEYGGEVAIDVVDPRTFVIAEGYDDLWEAPWCGTVQQMPMSWIKTYYPDKFGDVRDDNDEKCEDKEEFELEEATVTVYEIWMRDSAIVKYLVDDEGNYVLDKAGEKQERQKGNTKDEKKYPNGRIICFTKSGVRLDDKPSPYQHGKPPYVAYYDYRIPHDFWGMPEPAQIEELNREFNLRLQQMVHHASSHAKPNYTVDSGSNLDPEDVKDKLPEGDNVFAVNYYGNENPIRPIETAPIHPIHRELAAGISTLIEEVSGVTDVSKGMESKKQRQSATEISILLESSYTRTRQRVRNLEWSTKRLCYLILELMQQYYDEVRSFSYKEGKEVFWGNVSNSKPFLQELNKPVTQYPGEENQESVKRFQQENEDYEKILGYLGDVDKVYADFEIEIQTNSTLPMDKQSLANLFLRLAEVQLRPDGAIDRKALLEQLKIPNADDIVQRMDQKEMKLMAAKQGPPPQMRGPVPLPMGGRRG